MLVLMDCICISTFRLFSYIHTKIHYYNVWPRAIFVLKLKVKFNIAVAHLARGIYMYMYIQITTVQNSQVLV